MRNGPSFILARHIECCYGGEITAKNTALFDKKYPIRLIYFLNNS